MTNRHSDRVCCVCARPAIGVGMVRKYSDKPIWCCERPECLVVAKETLHMDARTFGWLDGRAVVEGGNEAGGYLDEIDKTDLAELSEEEWAEFCRRLVGGYRSALETTLRDEPPF